MTDGSGAGDYASISYVRPGPDALAWLLQRVHALKGSDPCAPIAVLVPNFYAGRAAATHLAQHGGYLNVRITGLTSMVTALARQAPGTRPQLTRLIEMSAVRAALAKSGEALASLAGHVSLQRELVNLFRELRRRELDPATLRDPADGATAAATLATYEAFRRLTAAYDDPTRLARRAWLALQDGQIPPTRVSELGAVVVWLPTRLDEAEAALLGELRRWIPVHVALPWLADPDGLADEPTREHARALASALRSSVPDRPPEDRSLRLPAGTRVVRAPDPADEVREVVRLVVADLEIGVPLHRTAILYRQSDRYAALVQDGLTLAGLPWSGLEGRSLAASQPGRAFLGLLELPERRFARGAVLAWLDMLPRLDVLGAVPPTRIWARLARAAGVVHGARQWVQRLRGYAAARRDASTGERASDGHRDAARLEAAAQAEAIADAMQTLAVAVQPPPDGSPWRAYADWAADVWRRFVRPAAAWLPAELAFVTAIDEVLAEVNDADPFGATRGTTAAIFMATLAEGLSDESRSVGQFGHGPVVGPVQSVTGLTFDRVYVLGMVEGQFPPAAEPAPLLAAGSSDPLGGAENQRAAERRAFLTALASADGGAATLSMPDAADGRAAFPSRWLLEAASACGGGSVLDSSTFRLLPERAHPWLRVIRSPRQGIVRADAPADIHDRRLRQVVDWVEQGRDLVGHALGRRRELPLGAGLALARARRQADLTAYDGNVGPLDAYRAIGSATAVEKWVSCPFQFFLSRILRVEPTELPEDAWVVDALARGSLVHDVLAEFFRTLAASERPAVEEPYQIEDFALLESLARARLAVLATSGSAGHPLVASGIEEALIADLRAFLVEETRWRRAQRLRPRYVEQPFGTGVPSSWPPVVIDLGDGQVVFRGYIDRVDVDAEGRRAFVFDYKTGKAEYYRGVAEDPVDRGAHVQLALYRRAAKQALGDQCAIGGAYWCITARGGFELCPLADDGPAADARLTDVIGRITRSVGRGVFPAVPGDERQEVFAKCDRCDFDRICPSARDDQWIRKQQDPSCADYLDLHTQAWTP